MPTSVCILLFLYCFVFLQKTVTLQLCTGPMFPKQAICRQLFEP